MNCDVAVARTRAVRWVEIVRAVTLYALTLVPASAAQPGASPQSTDKGQLDLGAPATAPVPYLGIGIAPPRRESPAPVRYAYSPWNKLCGKDGPPNSAAPEVCIVVTEARLETGPFVGGVALVEPAGNQPKILRLTFPTGVQLPQGTRLIIDQGTPMQAPYIVCLPSGCMSDFETDAALLNKLMIAQALTMQAIDRDGRVISVEIPLQGFAKAHSGPALDPKVLAEQKRKFQDQLQRHAQEERERIKGLPPQSGQNGEATIPVPAEK